MRPEWRRHLDAEQVRAAHLGRQWHVQRHVDIGMSGADELEACQPHTLVCKVQRHMHNLPRIELSAHWWHG